MRKALASASALRFVALSRSRAVPVSFLPQSTRWAKKSS